MLPSTDAWICFTKMKKLSPKVDMNIKTLNNMWEELWNWKSDTKKWPIEIITSTKSSDLLVPDDISDIMFASNHAWQIW